MQGLEILCEIWLALGFVSQALLSLLSEPSKSSLRDISIPRLSLELL